MLDITTVSVPLLAAACACLLWAWVARQRAIYRYRDDLWDRRKQGAGRMDRLRWRFMDRDGRRFTSLQLQFAGGVVGAVVLVAVATSPLLVIVLLLPAVIAEPLVRRLPRGWALFKQRQQHRQPRPRSVPSQIGVYVLDVTDPTTRRVTHGRVGHGNLRDRIRRHRSVADVVVRRIVRCATKQQAYGLEQAIIDALEAQNLMLPADRANGGGREMFYAVPEAYRVIEQIITRETSTWPI